MMNIDVFHTREDKHTPLMGQSRLKEWLFCLFVVYLQHSAQHNQNIYEGQRHIIEHTDLNRLEQSHFVPFLKKWISFQKKILSSTKL